MHDELSTGIDRTLVPTNHAQRHRVVGSLGNVLHLLESCVELGGERETCLLRAALKVTQQELVLTDPLYGLN